MQRLTTLGLHYYAGPLQNSSVALYCMHSLCVILNNGAIIFKFSCDQAFFCYFDSIAANFAKHFALDRHAAIFLTTRGKPLRTTGGGARKNIKIKFLNQPLYCIYNVCSFYWNAFVFDNDKIIYLVLCDFLFIYTLTFGICKKQHVLWNKISKFSLTFYCYKKLPKF